MGRTATKRQRAPLPATQKVVLKQPTITEDDVRRRAMKSTSNEAPTQATRSVTGFR
jgi:hypothetical protein